MLTATSQLCWAVCLERPISWSDWPAPRHPLRSLLAIAAILGTSAAIAQLDPWLAVVGTVVLVLATAEVLLPRRYALSGEGVEITGPFARRTRPWRWFGAAREVPEGFLLRGQGSRPALRRHRTVLLRCGHDRSSIRAALSEHLGPVEPA